MIGTFEIGEYHISYQIGPIYFNGPIDALATIWFNGEAIENRFWGVKTEEDLKERIKEWLGVK